MQKTSYFVLVPLHDLFEGMSIALLKRYGNEKQRVGFRKLTNQHVNLLLKILAHMTGIDKKLCFHSGRYSFA